MLKSIGLIAGIMTAVIGAPAKAQDDNHSYQQTIISIEETMLSQHYNPQELQGADYKATVQKMRQLGATAQTQKSFLYGFKAIWRNGPFSHVQLVPARGSADKLAEYLDTMQFGGGGAILSWQGDVAILTVSTMMGQDTIKEIEAAYSSIASAEPKALIIDLRDNEGGAFAIRPLIEHIVNEPFDAGGFVAQNWNKNKEHAPGNADLAEIKPWNGWSVRAFWDDVQNTPLVKVHFEPREPSFDGPVYVLTSSRTASAAELAADALKASGRATIVGELTAGKMLSQKPFDIVGGLQLYLPIADYYSVENGRIEGVGVSPDVAVAPDQALETALQMVSRN